MADSPRKRATWRAPWPASIMQAAISRMMSERDARLRSMTRFGSSPCARVALCVLMVIDANPMMVCVSGKCRGRGAKLASGALAGHDFLGRSKRNLDERPQFCTRLACRGGTALQGLVWRAEKRGTCLRPTRRGGLEIRFVRITFGVTRDQRTIYAARGEVTLVCIDQRSSSESRATRASSSLR